MDYATIVQSDYFIVLVGFLVGAVIGLERQFSTETDYSAKIGERMPGIRTFGLISLLGAVSALYSVRYGFKELLIFSTIVVIALIIIYSILRALYYLKDVGITTAVAMALAFLSGTIIGLGNISLGVTLSIFTTFILAIKQTLSNIVRGLEYKEIKSALEIGILALLLLPLIPDVYDPFFHVINLRIFFFYLILVLFIGFIAYVLLRRMEATQGLVTFTVMGGLIHSEATVMNFIRILTEKELRENPRELSLTISTGVLIANTSMVIRTILLVAILAWWDPRLVLLVALVLGLPSTLSILLTYLRYNLISQRKVINVQLESPLSYRMALKFTIAFTLIAFLVVFVEERFMIHGLLIGSAIGGFVSNSAVVLSVISLYAVRRTITLDMALEAILLSTVTSILNKIYYAKVAGASNHILKRVLIDNSLLIISMILMLLLVKPII